MFNEKDFLELEVRRKIYECVKKSPGLHFREIQRRVALATGSLDYHLHFMHKHGFVRTERGGKFLRYYTSDVAYTQEDKELLSLLRQESIRHILIYLIERKRASAGEISEALGISPSNLSRYLGTLSAKNVVRAAKRGRFRYYAVRDRKSIIACLLTYKSSFLDAMVDRFIAAWEE